MRRVPNFPHSEMTKTRNQRNIVMFPFMSQGHLIPFMALARQIEQRKGLTITIVNTPLNIRKLRSSLPPATNIRLVEIPFCSTDHGLPPDSENTDTLSFIHMIRLLEASENLESPFKSLLVKMSEREGRAPICIISNMFMGWTVKVANELGIFHTVFIAGAGYSMALYFSISMDISLWQTDDHEEFSLPDFPEAFKIHQSRVANDLKYTDAADSWFLFRKRQFSLCLSSDAILLNTIEGLGQKGVKYFSRKLGGKPIWTIGPISSSMIKDDQKELVSNSNGCYTEWLNLYPPASVLYVSFGSHNSISAAQTKELAIGLEASGKAFIWVARSPTGFDVTEEFRAEWLPDGFKERLRRTNQGMVIHKWAPQQEILSHKSIGAFLSHCGWNSILESLCEGIPIIGWPLAGEQFFNSHMLEKEVGVCIEVGRGNSLEVVRHDRIAKAIKMVMNKTGKGEEMRRKAREMREKMEDAIREGEGYKGSSAQAVDEFISTAISTTKTSVLPLNAK
ncbi:UDP-glycosyltransferase 92A1-like [Cornus florida]|uniref:UDP-glycosyltransferase 92A1-like n=1 Tax=Cornus florida TaxID=4283 RepID=UPI00289AE8F8|nr:UDP-glycosyltransferase 92A1-like [Cornus florida]